MDNSLPNLVNLNEDPQLSEMLLYMIKEGQTTVGKCKPNSAHDIQLSGVLIADDHWYVFYPKLYTILGWWEIGYRLNAVLCTVQKKCSSAEKNAWQPVQLLSIKMEQSSTPRHFVSLLCDVTIFKLPSPQIAMLKYGLQSGSKKLWYCFVSSRASVDILNISCISRLSWVAVTGCCDAE